MSKKETLALIGLGAMGGGMAGCLLQAGYRLKVFDLDASRLDEAEGLGARRAGSPAEAAADAAIVLTSLPSPEIWRKVSEEELLPAAQPDQVYIDLGTAAVAEVQRIAALFSGLGAYLLDAPVSGGPQGAADGSLHIFVGGEEKVFRRVQDFLRVLGNPERVVYCGPSGSGQIVKGVNQLMMGLPNAALLEAVSYGVQSGIDPAVIASAVGGESGRRKELADFCRRAGEGLASDIGIKHGQYSLFLEHAEAVGFPLPITRALYDFCAGKPATIREANRMSPSFWDALRENPGQE